MAVDFTKITDLLKSDKAQFVYGIFKNWYVLAATAGLMVTYYVLEGMTNNGPDGGTLGKIYREVESALSMIEDLSKKCPALIEDLGAFFDCIGL